MGVYGPQEGDPARVKTLSVCVFKSLSHGRLFAAPWTATGQAPLSLGFPRQENWSGLPFPPPEGLPLSGIEPALISCIGR